MNPWRSRPLRQRWGPLGWSLALVLGLGVLGAVPVSAETTIGILDFELNDLTYNPMLPDEVERTATLRPLLEESFASIGGYRVIKIAPDSQASANKGFGYLYDHHDVAAELGKSAGARWLLVGRVHKASYLFVYFKAQLLDTVSGRLVGDYSVEVKGPQKKLTIKGVESLSELIDETIRKRGSPSASSGRI